MPDDDGAVRVKPYNEGNAERRVVLEGANDFHFLFHWLKHHDMLSSCCFEETGGITDLLPLVHLLIKTGKHRVIGVVLDADASATGRWKSLREILRKSGYGDEELPKSIDSSGAIVHVPGKPVVGVWIMPDNVDAGYVEHFAERLLPATDQLWPVASGTVEGLDVKLRLFKDIHKQKAKVHTWLAWQKQPGTPLGQAITKQFLDPSRPAGVLFQKWLTSLLAY